MHHLLQIGYYAASEDAVLLKNERNDLPILNGEVISLFGRSQIDYYKSGFGSGGMVNTDYVVNIVDGIKNNKNLV